MAFLIGFSEGMGAVREDFVRALVALGIVAVGCGWSVVVVRLTDEVMDRRLSYGRRSGYAKQTVRG